MSNLITHGLMNIYPKIEREIQYLCDANKDCIPIIENKSVVITTAMNGYPYFTTCYAPNINCVFFIPYQQVSISKWHYLNLNDNNMYEYNAPLSYPSFGFLKGIYDYKLNRIILTHWQPFTNKTYIIDTSTIPPRIIIQDTNNILSTTTGGIYDDTTNRIICFDYNSASLPTLYYIDISSQTLTTGVISIAGGLNHNGSFIGCKDKTGWIYIFSYYNQQYSVFRFKVTGNNITSDNIQLLELSTTNATWLELAYLPHLNRIYYGNSQNYIDCNTFTVQSNGTTNVSSFSGAKNGLNGRIYYPTQNDGLYSLRISDNQLTRISTDVVFHQPYHSYITDKNGDIYYFPLYQSYTSIFTYYKLNMNLKVKPSYDLLLSGIVNY